MLKMGTGELIVILAAALIIFGPSRLPALGKMVGKAIGTLRHYANTENWDELAGEEEKPQSGTSPAADRVDHPVQEKTEPETGEA